MKKILILFISIFAFINVYKADCTYTDIKNLNILSTYVDVSYNYNDNGTFTLNILNVPDELAININGISYRSTNHEIHIPNYSQGQSITITVVASNASDCVNEQLRTINYNFPYFNNYYGNTKCIGHEDLDVCSHKFLNYQLSELTFNKLIDKAFQDDVNNKRDEKPKDEENQGFWDVTKEIAKKSSIPVLLVIVSTILTVSICAVIYRKIKHGL